MSTGAGRSVTAWLAAAALCAVVGCADEPEQDQTVEPPAAPTCDVGEVLMRNGCLACHGAGASLSGGGVDLRAEHLEASVKGVRSNSPGCGAEVLVNTERPEASVLLYSVSRGRPQEALSPGCVPMPMPLGGGVAMPAEDVACLERWVRSLEPEREPEVETRYTAPALSTLTRVKYLLDGGAVTELELQRGSQSDGALSVEGLEALVAGWMTGERFHRKRRQFLELQLQQTPSDGNYVNQFRNTRTNNMAPVREALNQSLIRTAERLIDDGEDFRSILTTSTWEVTTTTLLALKMADNPMVLRANGVWIKNHAINDLRYVTRTEGLYDRERDTADWRTVTLIHNPSSTDMTTEEEIMSPANAARLRAIPDGGTLELRTPRLGFFTSPAFFQTWQTNRDNDFRVIINQAMIIATGLTFSPGDSTPLSGDLGAVDSDLFPRDSTCYGCHKNLDPMRSAFLAHFDPINTRHRRLEVPAPQPGFAFQGHRAEIDSLRAWADALAQHPNFATAWVLKLCQWASSIDCAPSDPQVVELAQRFAGSGYQLSELFVAFFTSPLVTQTSDALDSVAPGAQVSVARRGHYCHAVEARHQTYGSRKVGARGSRTASRSATPMRCSAIACPTTRWCAAQRPCISRAT